MVIERYPHTLIYTSPATDDWYNEETGTWEPGQPGAEVSVNCRVNPAGAGKKRMGQDGQMTEYAYDLAVEYDENFNVPQNAQITILGVNDEPIFSGHLGGYQIGNQSIIGWI